MARTPAARDGSRQPDRQPDRLDAHLHARPVRRVGRVLHLLPDPFPAIAAPRGRLPRNARRTRRAISRAPCSSSKWSCCSRSRSRSGPRGSTTFPRSATRCSCRSPASSSRGTSTTPAPTGVFGRTDIKLLDLQSNPLGLDRTDPAAKDDVTTLNQLYLPVNKPIIVRLRSKDVIHSFGVPEFRVKQDAIPGLTIPIWFVPNVTTAEMRTRTGEPRVPVRDRLRAALRPGPCRDARLRHRADRRGVPEVDGGTGRSAERTGSVQVESIRSQLPTSSSRLPRQCSKMPWSLRT